MHLIGGMIMLNFRLIPGLTKKKMLKYQAIYSLPVFNEGGLQRF